MTERVTLILGEDRIEVSRLDLISKSEYFASLSSTHFKDCMSSEHHINYEIDVNTLQSFVQWVSDPVVSVIDNHRHVKPSLEKYVADSTNFDELLQLLQLSMLYIADSLVEDLTDLLARHWLISQKCVQIWLLAKELGLTVLRDLAKATCIDCLQDVPEPLLLELQEEDFIELVGNVFVKVPETFLLEVVQQWVKSNVPAGESNDCESRYPFTLMQGRQSFYSLKEAYEDQYWKYNIQCIVGHKSTPDNEVEKCVYGWDGTTFSEIVELSSSPIWSSNIVGLQILGRGFDIYLVGGEYGKGSGVFQTEIWRYSTLSKAWYYVTRMPQPRRHMAVRSVDTKLILAGGKGQSEDYLDSMDVYDINTGEWSNGSEPPEAFSSESLVCPNDGLVTFYNVDGERIHTYDPDANSWVLNNRSGIMCYDLFWDYDYLRDFCFHNHRPHHDQDLVDCYNRARDEARNHPRFGDRSEDENEDYDEEESEDDGEQSDDTDEDDDGDEKEDADEAKNEAEDRKEKEDEAKDDDKVAEKDDDTVESEHEEEDIDECNSTDEDEREMREFKQMCDRLEDQYIEPKLLMIHKDRNYVLGSYADIGALKIFECEDFETGRSYFQKNCSLAWYHNQVNNGPYMIGFLLTRDGTMCVERIGFNGEAIMNSKVCYREKRTDIKDLCPEDPIGCFNVYNPTSLNELFILDK